MTSYHRVIVYLDPFAIDDCLVPEGEDQGAVRPLLPRSDDGADTVWTMASPRIASEIIAPSEAKRFGLG